MSDDPASKDLPFERRSADHLPYGVHTIVIPFTWSNPQDLLPEGRPADHLPYGADTIVVPFTWSNPQRPRLPSGRFGGPDGVTGCPPPDYVGQGSVMAERQFAMALKDVRQTSTELALSALRTLRGSSHSLHPHDAGTAAATDAGLSTPGGTSNGNGDRGSLTNSNVSGATVRLGAITPGSTSQPSVPQLVPPANGGGAGRTTASDTTLPMLDVTPPGASIAAANPDPYASSDVGGTTVRLGTVTLSQTSRLGDLSMRYETGYSPGREGKAAGVVSSGAGDPGGVSYGAYQFASSEAGGRQVQAFLKSPEGARWANQFKGMDPTQPGGDFAQQWKKISDNEPDKFFQAQHEYIKRTHYDPVVQKVQHATSLDINQRSRALQNVIWSMSVQHGRAASLVTRAVQQAGPQGNLSNAAYDRKLINQLYAVRSAYVDMQGRPDLKTRYATEQHDALREFGDGGP